MLRTQRARSALFLCASLFVLRVPAAAAPFTLLAVGDQALEDLRFVARESGESLLSLTPPLSADEVRNALESIDPERLSPAGSAAYSRVRAALLPRPMLTDGAFGFSVRPELTLEGRFRTDEDSAWTRAERDSASLLSVPLEFYFADRVYASGDLSVRADPTYYDEEGESIGSNVPYEAERFDLNIPLRSFLSAGGGWWSVQVGRDRVSFGAARTGNLAINDTPSYYDFGRFSLFSPNFKYSLFVSQHPLDTSALLSDEVAVADTELAATTQRYLYYHRWDFRLFRRVSVGVGEGAMVGNSPLELRFLNPLSVYHGFFAWLDYPDWVSDGSPEGSYVGSLLSVDLDWAVAPGWAFYGQFILNEYATEYEQEKWPDSARPNGLGYLAGLEHARSVAEWAAVFNLEAVYADPYLYTLSSPFASYISMRRLSALSKKDPLYSWIGHPQGRDFALFALSADFSRGPERTRGTLGARLEASCTLQGEHGLVWNWYEGDSADEVAPSGTIERRLVLKASPRWCPVDRVTLEASLALVRIDNAEHVTGNEGGGAEASLSVAWKY